MEETPKGRTREPRVQWKRVTVWGPAILLLGFITYFIIVFTRDALTPSRVPSWIRLQLFIFPAFLLFVVIWFVFRVFKLRARENALKEGRVLQSSRRDAIVLQTDELILPVLVTIMGLSISATMFGFAFVIPHRPQVEPLRRIALCAGIAFLPLALVVPFRLARRKMRTGSYLPSEASIREARKAKPLWKRRAAAGAYLFLAILDTYAAYGSDHETTFRWVMASFLWLCAAYFVWEAFRDRKQEPGAETQIVRIDPPN